MLGSGSLRLSKSSLIVSGCTKKQFEGTTGLPEQTWRLDLYQKHTRDVSELSAPVVQLLSPKAGERILDLGCGHGVLTKALQAIGCEVVGVDSSPELVAAAQGLGLTVLEQDAERIDFRDEFDAVFSNAALHWMRDPDPVIENVFRSLRSRGRFVAECGGHGNVETLRTALIEELERRGLDGRVADPWYFPTVTDYGNRLRRAGFEVARIELISRPTPLLGDILGWLETFATSFTSMLSVDHRRAYLDDVRARVEPRLRDSNGNWFVDYVRLRFEAWRPAFPVISK